VHGHAFTLYPHGHVPYGREAIAPVALDGAPLVAAAAGAMAEREARGSGRVGTAAAERFAPTCFKAALDAAAG